MRLILTFCFLSSFLNVNGQPDPSLVESFIIRDCAHGHICCETYCSCCPYLGRVQEYDTLDLKYVDGVTRMLIGERYELSAYHEIRPLKYVFKKNDSEQTFYHLYVPEQSWRRENYTWDYRSLDTNAAPELVLDTAGNVQLINDRGKIIAFEPPMVRGIGGGKEVISIIANNRRVYGMRATNGQVILPFAYSSIEKVSDDRFVVQKMFKSIEESPFQVQGSAGLVNGQGHEIIKVDKYSLTPLGDNMYLVNNGYRSQVINGQGKVIAESGDQFKYFSTASEGLIAFNRNKKYGFMDTTGNIVIQAEYDRVLAFREGFAAVSTSNKWGFIDKSGATVIDLEYSEVRAFNNGVAAVTNGEYNKHDWMLIDSSGNKVSDKSFDKNLGCKNGIWGVSDKNSGAGLIDSKGKELIPAKYDFRISGTRTNWFVHGKMTVRDEKGNLCWINKRGRQIQKLPNLDYIQPLFSRRSNFEEDLLPYFLVNKGHKWGMWDVDGNSVLPMEYVGIRPVNEETVLLSKEKEHWLYSLDFNRKTSLGECQIMQVFDDGIIQLVKDGATIFINGKGERVDEILLTTK